LAGAEKKKLYEGASGMSREMMKENGLGIERKAISPPF
jgi:hypothetical protein